MGWARAHRSTGPQEEEEFEIVTVIEIESHVIIRDLIWSEHMTLPKTTPPVRPQCAVRFKIHPLLSICVCFFFFLFLCFFLFLWWVGLGKFDGDEIGPQRSGQGQCRPRCKLGPKVAPTRLFGLSACAPLSFFDLSQNHISALSLLLVRCHVSFNQL